MSNKSGNKGKHVNVPLLREEVNQPTLYKLCNMGQKGTATFTVQVRKAIEKQEDENSKPLRKRRRRIKPLSGTFDSV
ncbi:hypothetical protein DPMN_014982 [Dreissena polymorpha]|uniref:Uncharacterized protein n=1 Tax=Dreissena polymorpha TaxID=45954 RepID=A0A9D4NCS1_DREPO|nr:hypothetical protein DPMN_014982 [Dreissena polymorpha]